MEQRSLRPRCEDKRVPRCQGQLHQEDHRAWVRARSAMRGSPSWLGKRARDAEVGVLRWMVWPGGENMAAFRVVLADKVCAQCVQRLR
jgi:hypothetical protein